MEKQNIAMSIYQGLWKQNSNLFTL